MQLFKIVLALGLAVTSATASAVQPRDFGLCHLFATAGLTNLDKLSCASNAVDVPVQPELKSEVCLALHHAGADNLHEVGCPADILLDTDSTHLAPRRQKQECTTQRLCKLAGTSLIDLGIGVCTNLGSDAGFGAGGQACNKVLCDLLTTAGIIAHLFACT